MFMEAHFGKVELHMPDAADETEQGEESHDPWLIVRLDEADAQINLLTLVCAYRCLAFLAAKKTNDLFFHFLFRRLLAPTNLLEEEWRLFLTWPLLL